MSDSTRLSEEQLKNVAQALPLEGSTDPFSQELKALMDKHDVMGIAIYVLPESLEKTAPSYHALGKGHFYDTARLISTYVRDMKRKLMDDLDGLM